MAPQQQTTYVRVSYVIPTPTQMPTRLFLPPLGANRHGAIRPLLIPSSASAPAARFTQTRSDELLRAQAHPRHRLGVSSLALDSSTLLSGKTHPEGILYTGGRDGQIISWELGLKTKRRRHRYGFAERAHSLQKGRWETLTGCGDYMDEQDDSDEDVTRSDGDILGDVVDNGGEKRRKSEALAGAIPYEESWELDPDGAPPPPSAFRQCIQIHTDWINDILLCNLNQTVVSASSDGSIRAWSPHLSDSIDPVLVGTHDDYVRCLVTSPHQPWIASGSFDRTIKLWDLSRTVPPFSNHASISAGNNPTPLSTLALPSPTQKASIYAIATDLVGSIIASGSPERVVRMWDPRTGKRTGKLVGHTDNIRAIVLSADGRYLLTGSADASIKIWSLTSQRCLHTFAHHTESVWTLWSQHPSLEIFYSGDRSGIVSRVDMEGCNTVDEGECFVICNANRVPVVDSSDRKGPTNGSGDVFRSHDAIGVNKIITMDDRFVWTATGSSGIKRWKVPPRRSLRTSMQTSQGTVYNAASSPGLVSTSRRTSGSSDVRRGVGLNLDNPRRHSGDTSPPKVSPTSPRFGKNFSTSTHVSVSADPSTQDEMTHFGVPYQSLVRLVSPHDPYALGSPVSGGGHGGLSRGHGDAEVATLYSAASIKSIPIPPSKHPYTPLVAAASASNSTGPYRRNTTSTLSPRYSTMHPDLADGNWTMSPRTEYEGRELAAMASPLEPYPDDIIHGEHGLVRSIILNDRMHALTINTAGLVAVWDIARCRCVGWYDKNDVLVEMGCPGGMDGATGSGSEYRSPRELLEAVRERIEGESVIAPWSTVDTRIGNLTVHLAERCFETEIYADEAGYGNERYYDTEQRLNVGKWVLSNLFDNYVRESLRLLRRNGSYPPTQSGMHHDGLITYDSQRRPSPSDAETRNRSLSALSTMANEANTLRTAVSTVVIAPSMIPAIRPDMSLLQSRQSSAGLVTPLIPIVVVKDNQSSSAPQSPRPALSVVPSTPIQRARKASDTVTAAKNTLVKELEYFSSKPRRSSAATTTPDDFSGWAGLGAKEKDKDGSTSQTPGAPSSGGFIGKLRQLGKSSKRPLSAEVVSTPGGNASKRSDESQDGRLKEDQPGESEPETDQSRFLTSLASQSFHPPTAMDAPPLSLPPSTEIILSEETQYGWSNVYRGTIVSTSHDTGLLNKVMPMWLLQYLLINRIPLVPNIKVGFGVAPWTGKSANGEADAQNPAARLTANRYLRVRKILAYVQDKIDKSPSQSVSRAGSISGVTPRSSTEAPRSIRTVNTSQSHLPPSPSQKDGETSKRARPEDVYELLCNDTVLSLNMTLASIQRYVWRSSAELLLFYRKKT